MEFMVNSDGSNPMVRGAFNFRDLGGKRQSSGEKITAGRIFRSASLAQAGDETITDLRRLGVRTVVDLRSDPEHQVSPNRWIGATDMTFCRCRQGSQVGDSVSLLKICNVSRKHTHEQMIKVYRKMPIRQAAAFRNLLLEIAQGELPLVMHCAVGKDRTGVASAIIMSLLGVHVDDIIEDYLVSRHFFQAIHAHFMRDPRHNKDPVMVERLWLPVLEADPRYLAAALDTIESEYSGVHGYLHKALGIERSTQEGIIRRLAP